MILLTRLNGVGFALNPDLLERVEATPDTVVALVDGGRYLVAEPVDVVVAAVRTWRASVLAEAHRMERAVASDDDRAAADGVRAGLPGEAVGAAPTVVPLRRRRP